MPPGPEVLWWLYLIPSVQLDVLSLRPLKRGVIPRSEFAGYLKSTPTAKGFSEVFYPGEPEHLSTQRKLIAGIDVEDATWVKLESLAAEYGMTAELELA